MENSITYISFTPDRLDNLIAKAANVAVNKYKEEISKREFLTIQQVATELQKTANTITKYIKNNKLIAMQSGRVYRVSRYELNNFIKKNQA